MVLVEQDTMMMLTTSITTTTRMLPVLPNTTMAGTDVPALLAVLPEPCTVACYHLLLHVLFSKYNTAMHVDHI